MGHLYRVTVDIEDTCAITDFEVIEIVNDSNPCPSSLGIDWEFDMNVVINLKKHIMPIMLGGNSSKWDYVICLGCS